MLAAALLSLSLSMPLGLDAHAPSLPIFESSDFVDIFHNDGALTNASAHVAWSLAVPLAGLAMDGRRGMWVAGLSWVAWTVVNETFFHPLPNGGAYTFGYGAEVRADLLTRIVPCATVLLIDLLRSGAPPLELRRPTVQPPLQRVLLPGIDDDPRVDPFRAPPVIVREGDGSPSLAVLALR